MPSDLALRVSHLAKTYHVGFLRKKVQATVDVSFEVRQGEIFGLLGPNGAGKTTTLKILLGLIRKTRGEAELLGQPITATTVRHHIGYLAESPYFYDYLSGREFLTFIGRLFGLDRKAVHARTTLLLEEVGMTAAADLAMRRYSKGMLQRIGVAQALINDPKLVILDEPLSGLDPLGRKQLRDLIAALRTQGKTVIFSSHILSDVELLADRVAILVRGRTVNTGPLHELLDTRILSTEVTARTKDLALVEALRAQGLSAVVVGNLVQLLIEDEAEVNRAIDLLRGFQADIVSVTPRKESLEDVVVRFASAGSS